MKAWIYEGRQGFPKVGGFVFHTESNTVYEVIQYHGEIDTRSREGNRYIAIVEAVGEPSDISDDDFEAITGKVELIE